MATQVDLMMGRIAIKNNFLTEEQLKEAIEDQEELLGKGTKKPLGEILVEKSFLNQAQLDKVLRAQKFSVIRQEDMLYGRIAVRNNFVSEVKINEALEKQMASFGQSLQEGGDTPRLGQILLKQGLLLRQQHTAILKTQERIKEEALARNKKGEEKDLLKNIKSCPHCSELSRECLYCGELMAMEKNICPNCSHPVRGG